MKLVCARFHCRVEHRATRAAEFGAEGIGLNLEFADGIHRRFYDVGRPVQKIDTTGVVIDAVYQIVVLRRTGAVGGELARGARALLRNIDARAEPRQKGPNSTTT